MKTAFVATYTDIQKKTLRDLICVAVPEHTHITVAWGSSFARIPSTGTLVYKPWPEETSSLMPGVETEDDWEVILSGDGVEII